LPSIGVWLNDTPITDSPLLVNAIKRDHDETGGIHHIHEINDTPGPHAYDPQNEYRTFINVSPQIQEWMFQDVFSRAAKIPDNDGNYYGFEFAGGVNGTDPQLLTSRNDYSYRTIAQKLKDGIYDASWIPRVAVFIHILSTYKLRYELNEFRRDSEYIPGQDAAGERSRPVPREVMLFTKHDDFEYLSKELQRRGVGDRIISIENDGSASFFERGKQAVLERIQTGWHPEHQSGRKEPW
jgi:hypothetical protein